MTDNAWREAQDLAAAPELARLRDEVAALKERLERIAEIAEDRIVKSFLPPAGPNMRAFKAIHAIAEGKAP
jgi:hypothetical protein